MATPRQIEANRRNAQKSTGPKTPEGKQAVSLNSLRHGLRAATVVLPREDAAEFQRLCDDLEAEWRPQTRTEQIYLEQMAVAYWKLRRHERCEMQLLSQHSDTTTTRSLNILWQAQLRLERSFTRAQRELEHLRKSRGNPALTGTADTPSVINPEPPAPYPLAAETLAAKAPGQPPSPQPPAPGCPPGPAGFVVPATQSAPKSASARPNTPATS
jgi:hypothetical protein